ncbi:DUF5691 domain-containing protein, partial [Streptomyces sp. LNU-CPARS28]|uniref:DUF5691 domain-containing protein n=1 Tax=Streptomyces sp. LNU-CPARS28 TaxID=3137371 RepID=UPI0031350A34
MSASTTTAHAETAGTSSAHAETPGTPTAHAEAAATAATHAETAATPTTHAETAATSNAHVGTATASTAHAEAAGRHARTPWEELVTAALLGTDRRTPPLVTPGRDAPTALLDAAAVQTVRRRAGLRPAPAAERPAP